MGKKEPLKVLKVAVHNKKGGCGKSTIARSLAAALQLQGKRVLVVDGDATQWSSATWFEARKLQLGDKASLSPAGEDGRPTGVLHVLAVDSPSRADIGGQWEIVIYDLPGRVDAETRAVLLKVDLVLVPLRPSSDDADCLDQTLALCQSAAEVRGRPLPVYVIVNALRRGTRSADQIEEFGESLPVNVRMLKSMIRDLEDVKTTRTLGLCPLELNRGGEAAKDLTALCDEFLALTERSHG